MIEKKKKKETQERRREAGPITPDLFVCRKEKKRGQEGRKKERVM